MRVISDNPVSHLSYSVPDLGAAAQHWASSFGAGPFYSLGRIVFDHIDHGGESCIFDHTAAFGQWGPIAVELQEIHDAQPASLAGMLGYGAGGLNHVSYTVSDLDAESARLEELGMPQRMVCRVGPVEVVFHDAAQLGHAVELHRKTEFIEGFFAFLRDEAASWDGTDSLREMPAEVSV